MGGVDTLQINSGGRFLYYAAAAAAFRMSFEGRGI